LNEEFQKSAALKNVMKKYSLLRELLGKAKTLFERNPKIRAERQAFIEAFVSPTCTTSNYLTE